MRWNSNCPPERANGRYPSSSSTIRSSRDSCAARVPPLPIRVRSEEHTSELQSLMRISYAVFCLKKKKSPNLKQVRLHCNIAEHIRHITKYMTTDLTLK